MHPPPPPPPPNTHTPYTDRIFSRQMLRTGVSWLVRPSWLVWEVGGHTIQRLWTNSPVKRHAPQLPYQATPSRLRWELPQWNLCSFDPGDLTCDHIRWRSGERYSNIVFEAANLEHGAGHVNTNRLQNHVSATTYLQWLLQHPTLPTVRSTTCSMTSHSNSPLYNLLYDIPL